MSVTYTEKEILDQIEIAKGDMNTFYQQKFVNYTGKTKDTKVYYTEVVAEWCCKNIDLLKSIDMITREQTYKTESHADVVINEESNREEEILAKHMYAQGDLPGLGKIEDYQTPLKNKQTDKAGKIDLLAYDGSTLRILELKKAESKETMLRCVLEAYTYLRTVDADKLVENFGKPVGTKVEACPFVFEDRAQHEEMKEDRPHLKNLMKLLDVTPYYIKEIYGARRG